MPVIKVSVKWNGKKFDDVDLNTDEPGLVFKTQLFTLTGVAPERQKIMIKGGLLKDETDLDKLKLKSGHTFMMMGTADELPKAPEKRIVFMEDMTDTQLAEVMDIPSGLQNLGNTCYMNATLQCFRAIPELQTELTKTGSMGTDGTGMLASSLRDLFKQLKETTEGVPPLVFLQIFRNLYPQFAQQTQGMYSQQDAEECWGNLLTTLKAKLIPTAEGAGFVEKYMCGEFQSTLTCDDAQDETPVVANEMFTKLKCHINITINYMMNGIKEALDEKIEKNSPSLNRSAIYTKKSRVSRLPRYLTVDFVRFFWKPQERVKAKILRKVKFPMELDASEVCTVELQEKMGPAKQRILALAEEKANAKRAAKVSKNRAADEDVTMGDAPPLGGGAVDGPVAVQKAPETPTLSGASAAFQDALNKKALDRKKPLSEIIHPDLQADAGCNPSGQYELCAVLTHIGRSADSGHYMAWVKKDEDEWFKFDDDKVSIVKADEVTKLDGGGDWHMAYICLYRAKELE